MMVPEAKKNGNGNGVGRIVLTAIITCSLTVLVMWFTVVDTLKVQVIENKSNICQLQETRNRDWGEVKEWMKKVDAQLEKMNEKLPRR